AVSTSARIETSFDSSSTICAGVKTPPASGTCVTVARRFWTPAINDSARSAALFFPLFFPIVSHLLSGSAIPDPFRGGVSPSRLAVAGGGEGLATIFRESTSTRERPPAARRLLFACLLDR